MSNWRWRIAALLLVLAATGPATAQPADDPEVMPAQFTQPQPAAITPPGLPTSPVADPPTPVVRIMVRVPAHVAPGKDVPYRIYIANTSQADAYRVVVRNPIPAGVAELVKADPKPDKAEAIAGALPKELVWNIGTLRAGERREIELTLRLAADTKEIKNQAFVSFEHGQAVLTRVDAPKLGVTKTAPPQAVVGDRIPVRVIVENTGRVPVAGVELVENVSRGFEFTPDTGGDRTDTPEQRIWKLGTLRPGERKLVEYQLTSRETAELLAKSIVRTGDDQRIETRESTTKVLSAAMTLDLTGPTGVGNGDPGLYEIKVTNTGTMPLADVRVTATIPPECTLTRLTNGGRRYRDVVEWMVPDRRDGPLRPGQSYAVRLGLKSNTSGQRLVRVDAEGPRGLAKTAQISTTFQGTAVLSYTARTDPVALSLDREGILTVIVSNAGTEAAKNVRLRVELPPEVKLVQASPRNQVAGSEVVFQPLTVPAGGTETFTLTYQAIRAGQAWFRMRLEAEVLGNDPLRKEQAVQITGGR